MSAKSGFARLVLVAVAIGVLGGAVLGLVAASRSTREPLVLLDASNIDHLAMVSSVHPDAGPTVIDAKAPNDAGPAISDVSDGVRNVVASPPRDARLTPVARDAGGIPDAAELTAAARAARSNDVGREAMFRNDYSAAELHFEEAIRLQPDEPIFRFNLATTQFQLGRMDDAVTTAYTVLTRSPSTRLLAKTKHLIEQIRQDAKQQGIQLR